MGAEWGWANVNYDAFRFYTALTPNNVPHLIQRSDEKIALEKIMSGTVGGNPSCIQAPSASMSFCGNQVKAPDNLIIDTNSHEL